MDSEEWAYLILGAFIGMVLTTFVLLIFAIGPRGTEHRELQRQYMQDSLVIVQQKIKLQYLERERIVDSVRMVDCQRYMKLAEERLNGRR